MAEEQVLRSAKGGGCTLGWHQDCSPGLPEMHGTDGETNHFNMERTEMFSAKHKSTAFTIWGPNLLYCSPQIGLV